MEFVFMVFALWIVIVIFILFILDQKVIPSKSIFTLIEALLKLSKIIHLISENSLLLEQYIPKQQRVVALGSFE